MNKKLKKILAVVAALAVMFSFAACGEVSKSKLPGQEYKKVKTEDPSEQAKLAADDFLSAISEFRFKDAFAMLDTDEALDDEFVNVNGKDDLKQVMIDEMDIDDSELEAYGIESSFLGDLAADFVDMISIEYKINDVSENGDDTYTVNADIKMSTPNSEVLNGDIMESHGEEITNYMMELGLSESSSEEEQIGAVGKAIKYGFELMLEDVKNSPKETSEDDATFIVKKDGGKWIIVSEGSDIDFIDEVIE